MLSKGRREDGEVDDDSRSESRQASPVISGQVGEARDNPVGTVMPPTGTQAAPLLHEKRDFPDPEQQRGRSWGPNASMSFPRRVMNGIWNRYMYMLGLGGGAKRAALGKCNFPNLPRASRPGGKLLALQSPPGSCPECYGLQLHSAHHPMSSQTIQCGNLRRLFLFTVSTWCVCCVRIVF